MQLHEETKQFINRCLTEQDAYSTLRHLCDNFGSRISGSDAEKGAVEYMVSEFRAAGLEADSDSFDFTGWKAGESSVMVIDSGESRCLPCFPLGWCPEKTAEAAWTDLGFGMEEDFSASDCRGKIVLVSSANKAGAPALHRSQKYRFAVDAGAAGFLLYNARPGGFLPMGAVKLDGTIGTIPALGISYEEACSLKRNHTGSCIRMESASQSLPVTSWNAVGVKPARPDSGKKGPAAEEEVIVCGHIDSWFCPGAFDNGSGTVMLSELARLLRSIPLNRRLRFIAFGSEELGLMGSKSYAGRLESCHHIHTLINLDVSAIKDGKVSMTALGNEKLRLFIQSIVDALNLGIPVNSSVSKHSDHWPFQERGVPCAWTTSGSGYSYSHTVYDTLDKMDPAAFTLPLLVTGAVLIECAMTGRSFR